jgi:short-subunit dehydrogenase
MSAYAATKAAVISLSETLYCEYRSKGVNISVLCPTFFATDLMKKGRVTGSQGTLRFVQSSMERSRTQADDVARMGIDAVLAGQLYATPMLDGRLFWLLKRVAPQRMYQGMGLVRKLLK